MSRSKCRGAIVAFCGTLIVIGVIVAGVCIGLPWWSCDMEVKTASFSIATQWDGRPVNHSTPVRLSMSKSTDGTGINLEVVAPFYNDPAPSGPAGSPQSGLWDYEVVEAFFLGSDERYLEVELCPHGQHLVLRLNGVRNIIEEGLPLEFLASIQEDRSSWKGSAIVPLEYLPPGLRGFNAYAIHGTGEQREYQALYPAERGKHDQPDFHRLEYFKEISWDGIVDVSTLPVATSVWK
ncbi:UPF0462 protein C4orf33 homolog [Strongylocentrotus purpuratus]|uniref:Uncharacterized protein n=1 Tax=Strongylocentrotus purpuratus TaxID=7668 RepID=A0A7M7NGX3_STRPU|nr:UPF0462 protein C4orf33 homolog [Strongylocentrotus purpuratus]